MVVRRPAGEPVLIVDLDGTLLSINSFPRWARCLARARFGHLSRRARAAVCARTLAVLAARKLRLLDHRRLKWRLQLLWRRAVADDDGTSGAQFLDELRAFVRPEFAPLLAAVAAGTADAVLATAAAEDYADPLGRALGFRHVIATPATAEPPADAAPGEAKRRSIATLIEANGWQARPVILFTDHADDLPVMRIADAVYWFGPAAQRRACEALLPDTPICQGLGAALNRIGSVRRS